MRIANKAVLYYEKKVRIFYREYENQYTTPRLSQVDGAFTLCGVRLWIDSNAGICHVARTESKFLAG